LSVCKYLIETHSVNLHSKDKFGMTPFIMAASFGECDIVRFFFEVGVDINETTSNDATALYFASQNNRIGVAKFLLDQRADPNKATNTGATPLYIACEKGFSEIAQVLVQRKANVKLALKSGACPVHIASENGHLNLVKYLVEVAGADPNQECNNGLTPLYIACEKNHFDVVKYLVSVGAHINKQEHQGITPLSIASGYGSPEMVQYLLDKRADPLLRNFVNGNTPLHVAAVDKKPRVIEILCRNPGVDIDARDLGSFTPLCLVGKSGDKEIIKILLAHRANPNAIGWNRNSILHIASWCGHVDAVETMLSVPETNCNQQNIYGCTPLHLAAFNGNLSVVKILLKRGANTQLVDYTKNTALHHALLNNHLEIANLLSIQPNAELHSKNNDGLSALIIFKTKFAAYYEQLVQTQPELDANEPTELLQTSAHRFVGAAREILPSISIANVKLIKTSALLEHGEFPHYSFCEENGWHFSGEDVNAFEKVLFVSHRWGSQNHPDPDTSQFNVLCRFIEKSDESFEYIWLDYACICQNLGSELFATHLQNIPTALFISSTCLIIPKLVSTAYLMDSTKSALVTHLSDYLGRAWCVLESVSCLLTATSLVCSFQVGKFLTFKKFDRPEGAASDLGFYISKSKVWNTLLSDKPPEFMGVDWIELNACWAIKEPCRILVLLVDIFSAPRQNENLLVFLEKVKKMEVVFEDMQSVLSPEIEELWDLLGECAVQADKIVVFRLLLFIGYYGLKTGTGEIETSGKTTATEQMSISATVSPENERPTEPTSSICTPIQQPANPSVSNCCSMC